MCFSLKITEALLVPQSLYGPLIEALNLAVCGAPETCKIEKSDLSQAPLLKFTFSKYVEPYYDYTDYIWVENGEVKYAIGVNQGVCTGNIETNDGENFYVLGRPFFTLHTLMFQL